jgi:hypothetical protein
VKQYKDTGEVAAATCRLIKAVGKRLAYEDPEDLKQLVAMEHAIAEAWTVAIAGLRRAEYSDTAIGKALGTTKQAVQQRFPRSI